MTKPLFPEISAVNAQAETPAIVHIHNERSQSTLQDFLEREKERARYYESCTGMSYFEPFGTPQPADVSLKTLLDPAHVPHPQGQRIVHIDQIVLKADATEEQIQKAVQEATGSYTPHTKPEELVENLDTMFNRVEQEPPTLEELNPPNWRPTRK